MDWRQGSFQRAADALDAARSSMVSCCSEEDRDAGIAAVDAALDEFLAAPSASPNDLLFKVRALAGEYGTDWQPRHIRALVADEVALRGMNEA